MEKKTIAVDFDGTIVKHEFPSIGDEVPGAFEWLKKFKEKGARLILWTMRDMSHQDAALEYCLDRGLEFWAVNLNPEQNWSSSPKAYAHLYIDDAAFGCPLVGPIHDPSCIAYMIVDGQPQECHCELDRPYADWSVIGHAVMEWIDNGIVELIHPRQ